MLRNLISLLFCFVSIFTTLRAEDTIVQMMEGEVRTGLTLPIGGYHGGTPRISMATGLEGRYNFKGTPWDCGLMIDLSTACRGYNNLFDDDYDRWQNNRTLGIAALGTIIFIRAKKLIHLLEPRWD